MREHRGFEIRILKVKKLYYKIYKDGVFKQTSSTMKDAMRLIEFCVDHGVWK